MALNANALTTISQLKMHLDIAQGDTSQNTRLEMFINSASQAIESYCNRSFVKATRSEYRDGRRSNMILLRNYPATSVSEVWIDQDGLFTDISKKLDSSEYALVDEGNSVLLKNKFFPNGYNNIKIVYESGFDPIPADIEYACLLAAEWFYRFRQRTDIGISSVGKDTESKGILNQMPPIVLELIDQYKRIEFASSDSGIRNG